MFGTSVYEALQKKVSKRAAEYYTHPNSKPQTSRAVSLLLIRISRPTSHTEEITRNEQIEMRAWATMQGKTVTRHVRQTRQYNGQGEHLASERGKRNCNGLQISQFEFTERFRKSSKEK